jgi:hypothetical protein
VVHSTTKTIQHVFLGLEEGYRRPRSEASLFNRIAEGRVSFSRRRTKEYWDAGSRNSVDWK